MPDALGRSSDEDGAHGGQRMIQSEVDHKLAAIEAKARELERVGAADAARLVREALSLTAEELRVAEESLREMDRGLEAANVLAEAERQRYHELFEFAPDAYFVTDHDGVFLEANARASEMLGVPAGALRGHLIQSFVVEDDRPEFRAQMLCLFRKGARGEWRARMKPRGREPISASISAAPARDHRGALVGLRWLVRDRTEQERAREALRSSEARQRAIVETAIDGIISLDDRGVIESLNPAAERMFDFTADEVIGRDVRVLMPSLGASELPFERLVEAGGCGATGGRRRVYGVRRDGTSFPLHIGVSEHRADGRRSFTAVLHDVSERDAVEEALRQERDFAETLIETARVVVLVLDRDGRILRFNPYMEELSGYRLREVRGEDWFDLFLPDEDNTREVLREALAGRETHGVRGRLLTKDGSSREIEWYNAPLRDSAGDVVGLLAVGQDITDRRRLEQELLQAQKMEAIGQLSGGIAHDFNNLLMGIMGCASIALNKLETDHPARKFMEEVRNAAMRGAALPSQLLAFSRKREVTPSIIDLGAVVSKTEKMLRRMLGEDIDLRVELHGEESRVLCDQGRLEQVLMNLAVNARDAMPDGGRLTVCTELEVLGDEDARRFPGLSPGAHVVLRVSDTGCGMDEKTRERIFEPFFTTKAIGQGTGLGLSTVYGIVKQCGGHVGVTSEVGAGTTFTIRLPRADAPAEDTGPMRTGTGAQRGSETVLLVEDEPLVRMTIRHYLERWGYRVLEAGDGAEALDLYREHGYGIALVVTDMVLPQVGGAELAQRLLEQNPDARILFMSAYASDKLLGERGYAPIQVSLRKPFTEDALLAKVQEALGKSGAPPGRPGGERRTVTRTTATAATG